MKKYLVIFILFGIAYCLAKITVSSNIDDKQCDVFVQVNEDSDVIFLETMHIPGQYMSTACWGTVATMCHVKQDEVSYINGMKMNGTTTFLNNENQICYFENLGLSVGNMGGFYYQPWSYVYSVNIRVSCEDSSSVPQYCAKTEKMAKQVLLAKEELECEAEGGKFEGGVYRFKMPNDSIEYCVAGRCDVCHSQWYKKFVEHWKDSVCCETRGKEPNTNNGTCISPPPFDSTKIGVNHSKITAFPGCSKADAGTNNNFCYRSSSSSVSSSSVASSSSNISSSSISSSSAESSSSDVSSSSENSSSSAESSSSNDSSSSEDSSSSGDSSSSEESSSSNDSSSSEEPYSSSEEQEDANCHPNSSEAQATLHNAEAKCWSMQMESGYQLDDNGCLTGECYGGIYSSDDDDESSSSSEWESSSSEDEQCIDVSLKKTSDEETDQWVYVGKEKYTSRTISYEEVTPSSGFFDALGRMYKTIKSKIKYFMGIDTKVKKTVEIGEELEVWKRTEIYDGEEIISYRKKNKDNTINIDSIVFENGHYRITEDNREKNYFKKIDSAGVEYFAQYEGNSQLKSVFYIGLNDDFVYSKKGELQPYIKDVKKDTIFLDLKNLMFDDIIENDDFQFQKNEQKNFSLQKPGDNNFSLSNRVEARKQVSCSQLKQNSSMPKAKCFRNERKDINIESTEIYSPGAGGKPTYGASNGELNEDFDCVKAEDECGTFYYHSQKKPLVNESIIVMVSNWKKDKKTGKWNELCWKKEDQQATYNHEAQHVENGRAAAKYFFERHMVMKIDRDRMSRYRDETTCYINGVDRMSIVKRNFDSWSIDEKLHRNVARTIRQDDGTRKIVIPASPIPTNTKTERISISCQ